MADGCVPENIHVKLVVAMHEPVSHPDNLAQVGKLFGGGGVFSAELDKCFTDDFQLPLQRRLQNFVALQIRDGLAVGETAERLGGEPDVMQPFPGFGGHRRKCGRG